MSSDYLNTIDEFKKARYYWENKFSGELKELKLFRDFPGAESEPPGTANYSISFDTELVEKMINMGNDNDLSLYIIMLTVLKILFFKYLEQNDIIVASPIYAEENLKFNQFVALRDFIHPGKTFKELLMDVKNTVVEGYQNEHYSLAHLIDSLGIKDELSMFRVIFLLENIHNKELVFDHINNPECENDIAIFVKRDETRLKSDILYNSRLFNEETMQRFVSHYIYIFNQVIEDTAIKISDVALISKEEANRILFELNHPGFELSLPGNRFIYELFEEQVEKTPENISLIGNSCVGTANEEEIALTYRELNNRSNRLASVLKEKGVIPNSIVGVIVDNSIETAVIILGILKSGGVYLPIAADYPEERIESILEDSHAQLIIIQENRMNPGSDFLKNVIVLREDIFSPGNIPNLTNKICKNDLAYCIYTSGTSGKSKGVLIKHKSIVNFIGWRLKSYHYSENDTTLQLLSYAFDGFYTNFYGSLLSGGKLIMVSELKRKDYGYIVNILGSKQVTNISLIPGMYYLILKNAKNNDLKSLRFIVLAGESSRSDLINESKKKVPGALIINEYGPTESTITAVSKIDIDAANTAVIGQPILNTGIYILNRRQECMPVGIPGELCIAGVGLANGYLNNIELTSDSFIDNPYIPGEKLYRTGDLARWLPDGNIEFLGRKDDQVKIRGYRIELAEVESHLLTHPLIKEAVVLPDVDHSGDKYLCAYIVPGEGEKEKTSINSLELRTYLSKSLPEYMIPSFYVQIDTIPLTLSGKIDRKSLLGLTKVSGGEYVEPGDALEKSLVEMWSEVLGVETGMIGIDSNFFDLGGHSLKATIFISRIHKEFDTKVPIEEIFRNFTIRGISEYIRGSKKDRYISIEPIEKREYYELSSAQKRMYFLQQYDLNSTSYNMSNVLEFRGNVNKDKLEETFKKLIKRHDSLRTSFKVINEQPVQRIQKAVEFKIKNDKINGESQETFKGSVEAIIERFVRPFDLGKAPLLRVGVIELQNRTILLIDMHHIISDGVSGQLLEEEFEWLYGDKRLAALRLQYKDYAWWQNSKAQKELIKEQEEYWINNFSDELPLLNIPTDSPRPLMQSFEGSSMEFKLDKFESERLYEVARENDATLYMVLLSIFTILLSRLSGKEDIIIGSGIAGRRHIDIENIIGMFVNTLAMRNYPDGEKSYKEFLQEVKLRTLEVYENQEYQYEDLVDKLSVPRDTSRNPLFDTAFALQNIERGAAVEKENELDLVPYDYDTRISKFDLTLIGFEDAGGINFTLEYSTTLFRKETIERFVKYFREIILSILKSKDTDIRIADIEILTEREKEQVLYAFNETGSDYPGDKTIDRLFEEEVKRKPDGTAVVYKENQLTYRRLNERANQLAFVLREKGVQSNSIVGMILDRSLEMIIGILGILKAGGAYLPIDPEFPEERITYMFDDSNVDIILTGKANVDNMLFTALKGSKRSQLVPVITKKREPVKEFDNIPIPDRSLTDYEKYIKYIGQGMVKNSITLQATRGCPYNCAYCCRVWPKKYVARSAENIFEEVALYYKMGVRRFVFIDDIFNLDIKNSMRFFELIIENQMDIQMHFPSGLRGDILTKEYIDLMIKAGATSFPLALETASPRLQKLIRKNLDIKKLRENLEYIIEKHPQVILELHTMLGFPTETEEEAMMTLNFIKSLKWIHFPYIHILKIYSNTDMEKLALENGIPREAIECSMNRAYHELPDTLPFSKGFALQYQSDFLNNYFLDEERLLHVLPYQMKHLTEDEIVQKYNSYLPVEIKSLEDLLSFLDIRPEDLGINGCLNETAVTINDFNKKLQDHFPARPSSADALNVMLLDLSQEFSSEDRMLYDVVEQPLGLLYLMTYLYHRLGSKINGKVAKARIDFDGFEELKQMVKAFKPDVIGIRALTFYKDVFHRTTAMLRQWGFNGIIIAGGPYATIDYETLLQDRTVDLAVLGEGEVTFCELIEAIIKNNKTLPKKESLKNINGISFRPGDTGPSVSWEKGFARDILMMDQMSGMLSQKPVENPVTTHHPGNLAYVIFTSGSTGKPKGNLTTHSNVIRVVKETNYIRLTGNDKILQLSNYSFDGSVFDIYGALLNNACLVMMDKEDIFKVDKLSEIIKKQAVTLFFLTTALFNTLIDMEIESLDSIRNVLFGGERVSLEHTWKGLDSLGRDHIIHVYGPTETTVFATYYYVNEKRELIPIGKPISNTTTYILDKHLKPVPFGAVGQICIGGDGLARGYLNNPEQTCEKIIDNIFLKGQRLYLTGDLGMWLPDGNIEFLGRMDTQIKIRGFRVELGEIESRLLKHELIRDAVVLDKEQGGDKYLCAYIVSKEAKKREGTGSKSKNEASTIDISELRDYLAVTLPGYMVPTYFVEIDNIPLTVNGKLDRKRLPEPDRVSGEDYVAPRDEKEEKLLETWREVLGLEKIGIKDNFFMLGGDSIKTIQISARMRTYGYRIEMRDIFQNPTIMELAPLMKKIEGISDQSVITGEVKLTPTQRWFFNEKSVDRHHFNQSVMVYSKERFGTEAIRAVFSKLQEHHDALRMRYIEDNGEVKQINEGLDYPLSLEAYDLKTKQDAAKELELRVNEIQASINLANGPLMKLGLFHLEDGDRLLIVIHHLVIDTVSWRILFEDMETLFHQYKKGEKLELPLKTDSFKLWSEKLSGYSNSELFLRGKRYWKELESESVSKLDKDFEAEGNYIKDMEKMSFRLNPEETNALLTKVHEPFGTEINDILLAGLGSGIRETFGSKKVLVAMEGHGREEIIKGVNISRTVGWFTSIYPVILNMAYTDDPDRQIKEVKESLHQVPDKGIGYGILKYLTSESNRSELEFKLKPRICFNYLGQFDEDLQQKSFKIVDESSGNNVSLAVERDYDLEISGMISDGQLRISIHYNKNHYKSKTMGRLISHYEEGLRAIISYCLEKKNKELTPSDFDYKDLSIGEIDTIFD
jgi:amino acid adenylation domain-containing protein/non-ribosomal peptide synthase protein (TIGR01720 family)